MPSLRACLTEVRTEIRISVRQGPERPIEGVGLADRFARHWGDRGKVRYPTARDLARNCSKLLDQVARERCTIVLLRWGRPVARLAPTDGDLMEAVASVNTEATKAKAADVEEARACIVELSEIEKATIEVFGNHPTGTRLQLQRLWNVVGREAPLAISRLEARRLVKRHLGSYIATPLGLAVAEIHRLDDTRTDDKGTNDEGTNH